MEFESHVKIIHTRNVIDETEHCHARILHCSMPCLRHSETITISSGHTMRPLKIGDFVLGETIGSGTYATVRLARHKITYVSTSEIMEARLLCSHLTC